MHFQNTSSVSNTTANAKAESTTARTAETNQNINANQKVTAGNLNSNTNTQAPGPQTPSNATPFTDAGYIGLIIAIALVAGAFGGFVSHLMNSEKPVGDSPQKPAGGAAQPQIEKSTPDLAKSVFTGIAAALLVPLFLQIISSQLLREAYTNYLLLPVFAGFCLVASISAKRFITSLSDQVLQAVEDAKTTANKANEKAEAAKESADNAQGTASSARNVALLNVPATVTTPTGAGLQDDATTNIDPEQKMEALINEYNDKRDKMKSGWTRTAEMTRIFRQMMDLVPGIENLKVTDNLAERENNGKRLAGYAYFFSNPNIDLLPQLIDSVINTETKPFGQYWGILAIGKVISENGEAKIDPALIDKLKAFFAALTPGTDRWQELKNILRNF